jgi:hypothetical protein
MFAKSNDGVQPVSTAEQQQSLTLAKSAKHDTNAQISTISRGVTIVGKILGEGTVILCMCWVKSKENSVL